MEIIQWCRHYFLWNRSCGFFGRQPPIGEPILPDLPPQMGGWGSRSDTRLDPALVRGLDGPDQESGREVGSLPAGYFFWVVIPEIFNLYELSRQKISKRSPRKLEKVPFAAGFTTRAVQASQNGSGRSRAGRMA